ncbi:hypothetical protein ACFWJM_05950 [Streptomyces sp. NPDC127077]|uniref:hypothetical protein n=1 Tax=Streptomyces sp. NPDC127077 TaxID=3347131 RepID=UPI00365DAD94
MTLQRLVAQFVQVAFETQSPYTRVLNVKEVLRSAQIDKAYEGEILGMLQEYGIVQNEQRFLWLQWVWTDAGLLHAQQLQRDSRDRAKRDVHLHNALVRWAYENFPRPAGSVDAWEFVGSEGGWYRGTELAWDEVVAALLYLEAEGLVTMERLPNGSALIRPTTMGINFATGSEDLRTFMAKQQPRSTPSVTNNHNNSITVHGNTHNSNLASGNSNSQTITGNVNAHALTSLVSQLRQATHVLDLPTDDAQDLANGINTLEREGSDPHKGRHIWRSIKRILILAITSATAAGSEQAVQAAITTGSELFD